MIKKQGNLKEVETQIKTYENTKQKGAEGLFIKDNKMKKKKYQKVKVKQFKMKIIK